MDIAGTLRVPENRAGALREIVEQLLAAKRVVLTTHVGADGDGAGSEAAVAAWLDALGIGVSIVNPTPFPEVFRFLLHREGLVVDLDDRKAERTVRDADLVLVLDTSESNRIAPLTDWLDAKRTIVVDHHPAGPDAVGHERVQDPTAGAAGELVYDMVTLAGTGWSEEMALGVYVALVSDTGSFRFSNTSPRIHAIAAHMLSIGVDVEGVFQRLYATFPQRRLALLREALATLESDPEHGITWMTIPYETTQRLRVSGDDFEGLIEHARSLDGTRVALLFREVNPGQTKVSLRSNGEVDVNRIAREFGGGGHVKASGAMLAAAPGEAVERVVAALRAG